MTPEASNYLRRCVQPAFALGAAVTLVSRVFWSVSRRLWPNSRRFFQPRSIRHVRRQLLSQDPPEIDQPLSEEPSPCALTLAVGSFTADGRSTWSGTFADEEVTVSLHRWNWLLRGVTDDVQVLSRDQGLKLMRSWIRTCQSQSILGRDAYSTGERIVNGCLFLLLTGGGEMPPDIVRAFRWMGRQVAENLEYYQSEQTGNHALNNARALLFAGLVADAPLTVDLAYAICQERLPKLVTTDGFLREGSSHYHFLFTRWVLEMLWLARRTDNRPFVDLLVPCADLLVRRCWSFLVRSDVDQGWQIPLIGDVSPDFPPQWLLGLPWSRVACSVYRPDKLPSRPEQRGWVDLFGAEEGSGALPPEETANIIANGWFRVDHAPWTVFGRAESSDGTLQAGHKHDDLGSFVLFRNGSLLLTDSGRLDYTASSLGRYGRSALAHNTLLIDELGPTADGPSWLQRPYAAVKTAVDVRREAEETVITIKHDGFRRLARHPILHQRRLRLSVRGVWIEDQLDGEGAHRVQARFHFAPGVELHHAPDHGWKLGDFGGWFVPGRLANAAVQFGQVHPRLGGWFFPAYGAQQASHTVDLSGTVNLPVVLTHALMDQT